MLTWRLVLLALLAGCSSIPAGPTPTPNLLTVSITPALRPLQETLQTCAAALNDTYLVIVEPGTEPPLGQTPALSFHLGEPEPLPEFVTPIAWDEVVAVINPQNAAQNLDADTLRLLFGGHIRNWGDLGGRDADVQVWVATAADESTVAFTRDFLAGGIITPNAKLAPAPEAMLQSIAEDPAAIGYLPRAWADATIRAISINLRLPVLAAADVEPSGAARALLACLQGEAGQQLLSTHYIPWIENQP